MNSFISVIICTHNPNADYLKDVLSALRIQTLDKDRWELLIVDNASDNFCLGNHSLDWHPKARYVREENLGLTNARLRGIQEAEGDILVFADDDNILERDYLEKALKISRDHPDLGAWGGQVAPRFEEPPPPWTRPHWRMLGVREFKSDRQASFFRGYSYIPVGAGLCVRRIVAKKYADSIHGQPGRRMLGRRGTFLTSCEDTDLAFVSYGSGFKTAIFQQLRLIHIIPRERLHEDYLLRLKEGYGYSLAIFAFLNRDRLPAWFYLLKHFERLAIQIFQYIPLSSRQRGFFKAFLKGHNLALLEMDSSKIYFNAPDNSPSITLKGLPVPSNGKTAWPWTAESVPLPGKVPDGRTWPKISIVTPSYNQGEFLEEAIRSVLLQGYPNLEYIVIDGGSTDNSVEIIRKYAPWLTHWVSEKDRGQADAINKGLKMATGEIIAWLNSDDYYEPHALARAAGAIDARIGRYIVAGDVYQIDANGKRVRTWRSTKPGLLSLIYQHRLYLMRGIVVTPAQPAVFWHKNVSNQMGPLRIDLIYAMDYEYWLRMAYSGYKFQCLPLVLANYRFHSKSKTMQGWEKFSPEWKMVGREYFLRLPIPQKLLAGIYWWCILFPLSVFTLPYRMISFFLFKIKR